MSEPEKKYCYQWPRVGLTCDAIVFTRDGDALEVLLILRKNDPYAGDWALPGGYLEVGETAEETVARELQEETGLHIPPKDFVQVHTYSDPKRNPKEHVVTIAFLAQIEKNVQTAQAGDDALDARWFDVAALPKLAFDHSELIATALDKLGKRP